MSRSETSRANGQSRAAGSVGDGLRADPQEARKDAPVPRLSASNARPPDERDSSPNTGEPPSCSRLERWERATEWPLTLAALVFLAVYSAIVISELEGRDRQVADAVLNIVWATFAIDYCVRLALASDRWRWFVRHLVDLAVVVLPAFRPLRLLRLYTALNVVQRTTAMALRGSIVTYTVGSAIMVTYVGALATFDAERHAANATITSFPRALWWAFVTITTVGYGDHAPVTPIGRAVATVLMIGGITIIGIVSATFASWIIGRVAEENSEHEAATRHQVECIEREVAQLRNEIHAMLATIATVSDTTPSHPPVDGRQPTAPHSQTPGGHDHIGKPLSRGRTTPDAQHGQ